MNICIFILDKCIVKLTFERMITDIEKSLSALDKAVQAAGSFRKLAALMNVIGEKPITGEAIWSYKKHKKMIPATRAVQIERCRDDMPTRQELRPDLYE